ncbi:unknown [Sinorhizobium phage PBC5]|uniref:portal protein n=1 Tax=Sinorhizobium phage PBC5 TaxID=179237 RepID=UPI000009B568|nr:portal protein [Sinorhizobium phage PBC5]AAL49568.1 unknown [Sinorhizobium phage PBC5]
MFDLNATDGSVRKKRYQSPIPETPAPSRAVRGNALDSNKNVRLHQRLLGFYTRELDRQYDNRREQAIDEDFYDNIQWTEEDAQTLRDRGQVPLVFNVTATTVDWVIGTEKRSRTDFKILPRRKEDDKPAGRKSELLKYLADVNKTEFHVSRSFADSAKVGVGWMEDGYQGDDEGEPLYARYESWRNMLWDSTATELDLDDGRYMFRSKWVDADIGCAMFPKRKALIERSIDEGDSFISLDAYGDEAMDEPELENTGQRSTGLASDDVTGYQRQRIRIIECWFRIPDKTSRISGGTFAGEIYDPLSRGHKVAIEEGDGEIIEKVSMRMYVALFTSAGLLWLSPSPYRHNRYPFTPIWNKRRGRDGMPYGMIRNIRDIQSDINKRASKALHILSSNKVIMDDGAVEDINELAEEIARPDAIIVKQQGKEFKIDTDRELGQWHLELMSRNISMLQQVGGVTDENLGRTTNAVSGKAIIARQEQGSLATAGLFDNHRYAQQVRGEKTLANMEQFMSEEKKFRITNKRGTPEYVAVNDGLPENDIVRTKADYVISEEDWRATVRQAQVESLMELLGKLAPVNPQIAIAMLDLIIEAMDIPQRDELVKRIRKVTGMSDPDQAEENPEEAAKKEAEAKQQQMMLRAAEADIGKKEADAQKTQAQALQIRSQITATNVGAQKSALEAAGTAIAVPTLADIADVILHEAGFVSRTEGEETMRAAAEQAAAAQADQAQQQPQQQQPQQPAQSAGAIGLG